MKKIGTICLIGGLLLSALYAYLTVSLLSAHSVLNANIENIEMIAFGFLFFSFCATPLFVYVSIGKAKTIIEKYSNDGKASNYFKYIADRPTKLGRFLIKHPAIAFFFAIAPVLYLIPFVVAHLLDVIAFFWIEVSMSASDKWDDLKWNLFRR
ncbi:MAG TPA: hypothetical protein PK950_00990 [Candidatus Paceibacterota bacterium]|nr:hypothetical protein [Candidatus Paceibacterota bacterium]